MPDKKSRGVSNVPVFIQDVPDAPTVSASNVGTSRPYNNGAATVTLSSPTGGLPTSYSIITTPSTTTTAGVLGANTITGLSSATSYTVSATATNGTGVVTSAGTSGSITATTVPQAPTIGTVSVTNATTVSVPFTAGASGGSSITSYTITSSPSISLSYSGTTSPFTVTGSFVDSQAYTFTIRAVNANGTSLASSASNSVTPISTPGFITVLRSNNYDTFAQVGLDSSGNIYALGDNNSLGTNKNTFLLAKFNSSGALQWQQVIGRANINYGQVLAVDGSGNCYVAGQSYGTNYDNLIAKYNSSGSLLWQRLLVGSTTYDYPSGIALDSSGNCYLLTYINGPDFGIIKYNSSGTLQWQRKLTVTGTSYPGGIAVDSSGNVFITGSANNNADIVLAKYNTSGAIQWQKLISVGTNDQASGIALDSSGNIYINGRSDFGTADTDAFIMQLDSTGANILWQKKLAGSGYEDFSYLALDSSNNIYSTGYAAGIYTVTKHDSSGNLLWQRTFTGSSLQVKGLIPTNSGSYIMTGFNNPTADGGDCFIASFPDSGGKTGTYTVNGYNYTYAAGSLTQSTTTGFTVTGGSFTDAAGSLTDSAGTATVGDGTLTATTTTF